MARSVNGQAVLAQLPTEFDAALPKGEQLLQYLSDLIDQLEPGKLLPGEHALADHFEVARMTVRKQVDELVAKGRVVRVAGRGTFVTEPQLIQTDAMSSFSRDIRSRGMQPGSRSVEVVIAPADVTVANRLEIEAGEDVISISRIRTADDVPMAIEQTNLPAALVPGLEDIDLATQSLFDTLESKFRIRPTSAEQEISAVRLSSREASLLEAPKGDPAFLIKRLTRDNMGRAIEYGQSLYRGDRYTFLMHVGVGA